MNGADLLRDYLTASKLDQAEFAAQAGVSKASVSQWLAGNSRPGYESALLVQSATGGAVPFLAWKEWAPAPDRPARKRVSSRRRRNRAA